MLEFDEVVKTEGLEGLRKYFPHIGPYNLSDINYICDKLDGSLISTYVSSDNLLFLKSKGSLCSDQANAAMLWLAGHPEFHDTLQDYARQGYTINMEWTAPDNRIVIGYQKAQLRVLNVRDNKSGEYMHHLLILTLFGNDYTIPRMLAHDTETFINSIPDLQGIEGYVVEFSNGQKVKIKTSWYLALHHTKDNINSPRRLFEAVIEETTDDMKTLFHDDPQAIQMIEDMEAFVAEKYNHMVDSVERFYERNKHMTRKDYAILGQEEFAGTFYFGLAMNKYTSKPFDYKTFLKSKWKQLGLKDVEKDDDE